MKPGVIAGVKKLVARRVGELTRLRIGWFGGEPLVAKDVIVDISGYGKRLADEHNVAFDGSMTTNGLLLKPSTLCELLDAGVTDYQVTLDGPREFHNRKRVTVSGDGTFDRIWANLAWMQASDLKFSVLIRLHLAPDNRHVLPAFVRSWIAHFSGTPVLASCSRRWGTSVGRTIRRSRC